MRELKIMDLIGLVTYKKQDRTIDLLVHKKSKFLDHATGITTIERVVSIKGIKIYG
jgi:hypothetical protein